uniref:Putative tail fibre protein n=1 Tax=Pseudomonas phage phi2 TaxID=1450169 RepID=E0WQA6_9CAUD|nr:putative tail fibre gene [Pseudomonas phage phi-2]
MAQVPNVSVNFDGDGVTAIFDFDFPYQKQSEVFVSVDGVNVAYTWLVGNTHSVQVLPAPALGTRVRIYRSTLAFVPLHVFAAGVPFLPRYVDENNRQMLYVAQESVNTSTAAMDIANEVRDRIDAAEDVAAEAIATANSAAGVAGDAATVAGQAAADAADALGVANRIADTANEALETANAADAKADEALAAVSEAGVASWNGRTAIVVPESGDYNAAQITYGTGNVADSKWDSVASDNTPGATPLVSINALAATIRSITAGTGIKFTVTAGNILLESVSGDAVGTLKAWKFNRATIPGGQLANDGQIITNGRTLYPELWALIQPFCVTDAVWLAAPYTSRGMFSSGNGSTDFRMPDDNGKHPDGNTISAMVLRGDGKNSAGTPGLHQADQLQNITGTFAGATNASRFNPTAFAGAFQGTGPATADSGKAAVTNQAGQVTFDASRIARAGSETRSANSTVIWCTVAAKVTNNVGTVDVTVLASAVATQGAALAAVQSQQVLTKFYESPPTNWTAGGQLTFTHNLGALPRLVSIEGVVTTAQGNAPLGARFEVGLFIATNYIGAQVDTKTTTAVTVRFGNSIGRLFNASSADQVLSANSQVIVRVFV